jgi:hypothetical protein
VDVSVIKRAGLQGLRASINTWLRSFNCNRNKHKQIPGFNFSHLNQEAKTTLQIRYEAKSLITQNEIRVMKTVEKNNEGNANETYYLSSARITVELNILTLITWEVKLLL